ncbi:MAG: response regulator receiver protein [Sphingobacteriales bacterium]|nr:response regulator receiver protein [Sphingobacteriales bacterium]
MRKKKIYVADDDLDILEVIKQILELNDYEVETSLNGLSLMNEVYPNPDLILLDILMPDTDGRDICRAIKTGIHTHHTPVIMMSAFSDLSTIIFDTKADDFITKPFEISELLIKIKKHLNQEVEVYS